jgi:hypothetical protein
MIMLRRAALLLAVATLGCNDDNPRATQHPTVPLHGESVADPAQGVTTELDGIAPELGDGLIAELIGNDTAARESYERILTASDAPADVAARAALHLAQLEARAGKSGRARDLIVRATALAPNDPSIIEGADRVRADIVAASGAGDIQPKLGTPLPGVTSKVAAAYGTAEQAFARVHSMRSRERLAVWEKEDATAEVVRRYRALAESGGVAEVAAEYRIGSLYHDLALGLMFEPVDAELRRTLFAGARKYLEKAATAYRASLAAHAPAEAETLEEFKVWRLAAESDLRAVLDVLGQSDR